ncbi:MAG: XdhC/CoxI family protein [Clostridia bacterium]|nr:XdhC/CoxI family protein [Clostridia bacterium]
MTQQDILIEQLKAGKSKRNYAVVTIIKAEGSTPRESGKMLVFADGKTVGTVGGGRVERLATADAVSCIAQGGNACKEYTLLEEGTGIGMSCGGNVTVFIEVYRVKPQLVMCGAGHVGGALIQLAQFCGYDVTLVDTRPDEYIQDKIDLADVFVHVEDFYQGVKELNVPDGCCFVIATFGHAHDGEALEAALGKNASYVGMVGSKRKVGTLFAGLLEKGFTQEQLDSVYTPIGLDIGSETPEEIALAVMAEIMKVKKGSTAKHLRDCDHK